MARYWQILSRFNRCNCQESLHAWFVTKYTLPNNVELVNFKLCSTIGLSPDHLNPMKQMSVLGVNGPWPVGRTI